MKIQVNGEVKQINSTQFPITVINVIKKLGHVPQLVVVEFNGVILPPKEWNDQTVKEGDSMEIVTIVGGGS